MKSKIWGTLGLSVLLAACSDESCRDGQVVSTQPESQFNQPGSVADFQATSGDRVYFDFDKYNVRAEQKDKVCSMAQWLNKYPSIDVMVGGYCDERGTTEYNLALGQQRANSTANALKTAGVSGGRIKEVCSRGKEHPLVEGHDEKAWQENRVGLVVLANPGCTTAAAPAEPAPASDRNDGAECSSNAASDVPMPEEIPAM